LTLNEMRAVEVYVSGERHAASELDTTTASIARLLRALALSNDAGRGEGGELLGDPTEIALWRIAADNGFDRRHWTDAGA
jgi:Ca2+-transporting ATPase